MHAPSPIPPRRRRDPRLDFFRGIGMFIIFIAHLPDNTWTLWIPARFGFSDATEMFVFCSGMASAIAFGKVFDQQGLLMGTARVSQRVWQVYWAHVCQFLILAAALVAIQRSGVLSDCCGLKQDYVASLNLWHFFLRTGEALPALLTLGYVPNYFDILPMYIVVLALMPVMVLLARAGRVWMFAAMAGLWLAASLRLLDLPAEPWSDRPWFFNPFAWQLLFFTGFALMRGLIPAPPVRRDLIVLAVLVVVASMPLAWYGLYERVPALLALRDAIESLWAKTEFGILRFVHFLALAYLAWIAVGAHGHHLVTDDAWGAVVRVVQKVGQQSLAVFLASLVIAQGVGILRDMAWGRGNMLAEFLANAGGMALLVAVAYLVAWYKGEPWRKPSAGTPPPAPPSDHRNGRGERSARAEQRQSA